jgi:hypothetical protein
VTTPLGCLCQHTLRSACSRCVKLLFIMHVQLLFVSATVWSCVCIGIGLILAASKHVLGLPCGVPCSAAAVYSFGLHNRWVAARR